MFKNELKEQKGFMPLNELKINNSCTVKTIPAGVLKSQLLRFGIFEGQLVYCLSKLPGGTMVIKLNRQEIAIGSTLAKKIIVELITGVN